MDSLCLNCLNKGVILLSKYVISTIMSQRTSLIKTRATVKALNKGTSTQLKGSTLVKTPTTLLCKGKIENQRTPLSENPLSIIPDSYNRDGELESKFPSAVGKSQCDTPTSDSSVVKRRGFQKAATSWNLVTHAKSVEERDELTNELENISSENLEVMASIIKKDELLAKHEYEINELKTQVQCLTEEPNKKISSQNYTQSFRRFSKKGRADGDDNKKSWTQYAKHKLDVCREKQALSLALLEKDAVIEKKIGCNTANVGKTSRWSNN